MRPVIICTVHKGVFFGYTSDTTGDVVHLQRAKMAIRWSDTVRGVLGLACVGPVGDSIVSHPADIEVRGVTAVMEVTPEAEAVWQAA